MARTREQINARRRERYATDLEYRRREYERSVLRRVSPASQARRRERDRAARADPNSNISQRLRNRVQSRTSPSDRDPERNQRYKRSEVGKRREERLAAIPNPRKGMPWTAEEDAIVARDDISQVEMAYLVGRSYGAVSVRRASVRYGRWPELKGAFSERRECQVCGGEFVARCAGARYCSSGCRRAGVNAYYRDRYRRLGVSGTEPNGERECVGCGRRFTGHVLAKFCTKQCKRTYHYLRGRAA